LAEFHYNNQTHTSTKYSPFEANQGYHPIHPSTVRTSPNPSTETLLSRLEEVRQSVVRNMDLAQKTYAKYYDRRAMDPPNLKEGDQVWLNAKHLTTTRSNKKPDLKYIGP
jgi:hypothetical protein